jgi:hypothetical protein
MLADGLGLVAGCGFNVRYRMNNFALFIALAVSSAQADSPPLPIRSGQCSFQHKFSEHPGIKSISLIAKIKGTHIVLINNTKSDVFPKGIVTEGTLMWHAESKQWIIGQEASDQLVKDVGGCSDGPEVIDLQKKIYWTC